MTATTTQRSLTFTRIASSNAVGMVGAAGVLIIKDAKSDKAYLLKRVAVGEYELVNEDLASSYDVWASNNRCNCSCVGFKYRGECRHTKAIEKLLSLGKI